MRKTSKMALYDGEEEIRLEIVEIIEDNPEHDGEYEKAQNGRPPTIRVVGTNTDFMILWTLFHEILHRWEDASGKVLDHDKLDEISRYQARVFQNSPRLVDFIKNLSKRGKRGK
jgi:Zn-dependent peptidase ImmA (M78 family)